MATPSTPDAKPQDPYRDRQRVARRRRVATPASPDIANVVGSGIRIDPTPNKGSNGPPNAARSDCGRAHRRQSSCNRPHPTHSHRQPTNPTSVCDLRAKKDRASTCGREPGLSYCFMDVAIRKSHRPLFQRATCPMGIGRVLPAGRPAGQAQAAWLRPSCVGESAPTTPVRATKSSPAQA